MIVQKEDLLDQIREAKQRGKWLRGGPHPSVPEEALLAGADYMILMGKSPCRCSWRQSARHLAFSVLRAKTRRDNNPIPRFDLQF